jgi:hypothetical protein
VRIAAILSAGVRAPQLDKGLGRSMLWFNLMRRLASWSRFPARARCRRRPPLHRSGRRRNHPEREEKKRGADGRDARTT